MKSGRCWLRSETTCSRGSPVCLRHRLDIVQPDGASEIIRRERLVFAGPDPGTRSVPLAVVLHVGDEMAESAVQYAARRAARQQAAQDTTQSALGAAATAQRAAEQITETAARLAPRCHRTTAAEHAAQDVREATATLGGNGATRLARTAASMPSPPP